MRNRAWVASEPQVGQHRYLQEKGGGIQKPGTMKWAACTGPRRKGRRPWRRIVPTRGPDLPESSGKTWRSRVSCWKFYSRCAGDRAVLMPMNHRDGDSLPQRPIDSTLTVGILPSRRANCRSSKDDLLEVVFKTQQHLSKSPCISCSQCFLGERIHQTNLGFCWRIYKLPHW